MSDAGPPGVWAGVMRCCDGQSGPEKGAQSSRRAHTKNMKQEKYQHYVFRGMADWLDAEI